MWKNEFIDNNEYHSSKVSQCCFHLCLNYCHGMFSLFFSSFSSFVFLFFFFSFNKEILASDFIESHPVGFCILT